MAFKMEPMHWLIVAVLAYVFVVQPYMAGQTPATPASPGTGDNTVAADGSCNYAPTFKLSAADKFDSAVTAWLSTGHLYKINGGASQTYAGTAISVNKGDTVSVLWGYGNRSSPIAANLVKDDFVIANCGVNTLPYGNTPKQMTLNTSVTIQCRDEQGSVVQSNGLQNNYTITTGGTINSVCQLQLDNTKRAFPGGVLVAEFNSTAFDMSYASITGEATDGVASVPTPYTSGTTFGNVGKQVAAKIKAFEDTNFHAFTVTGKAQSTINPENELVDDIVLHLYSNNCFENSDTSKFDCGVQTNVASTWAGNQVGTTTINVD